MNKASRETEEKLLIVLDNINDVLFEVDHQGNFVFVSPVIEKITGYKVNELIGRPFSQIVHPDDILPVQFSLERILGGSLNPYDFRLKNKDGSWRYIRASGRAMTRNDKSFGMAGTLTDVTESKLAEEALKKSEAYFRALTENASETILVLTIDGQLRYINNSSQEINDVLDLEFGKNIFSHVIQEDLSKATDFLASAARNPGNTGQIEMRLQPDSGPIRDVEITLKNALDNPAIRGIIISIRDISAHKRIEEKYKRLEEAAQKLEFAATHDPLTGLPNRTLFNDHYNLALAEANRYHKIHAVAMLDIDQFKKVNDTLGHPAGDQLLKEFGNRLSSAVRKTDTISRTGGDEFTVLLTEVADSERPAIVAQRILQAVDKPFLIGDQEVRITASIGIANYPDHGEDLETLIKHADTAMYRAKKDGGNRYLFYYPNMES